MGVSVTFVMFVTALCLLDKSVLCDEIRGKVNADADDDAGIDLLTTVIDAARMVEPGLRPPRYDVNKMCFKYVMQQSIAGVISDDDDDGGDEDGENQITRCMTECILSLNEKSKQIFTEENLPDKECLPNEQILTETAVARGLPEKRWKWFKKVGAWIKKNGPKIVKGIQIAGKIIKGIVGLFGGK